MNKKMMGILACPMDKHSPLELFECTAKGAEVEEGALYCTKCSRFYPITGGIPIMLPDELRDRGQDMDFLEGNRGALPEKILRQAVPWHL